MKQLFKFLQKIFFPTLIFIICAFLFWENYVPGTFLSGWDTLHPEFNLSLYLKRALNGVWMEHQGLGAVASQAHPAEIPRLLVIFLLDVLLPLNLVRYSFFFLCLALGAFGVYFLCKYLLGIRFNKFAGASSFLASLFYVLNLTTVQQFYVPLEMFAVHFAALPWLFLFAVKFAREGGKSNLLWFAIANIFGASMAHTPTLFYAYLANFIIYFVFVFILKPRKVLLKRILGLALVSIFLNLYWILPNFYYLINHAEEVESSKIHSVFTGEATLQSKAFGTFNDLILSKNFLFNWREFDVSKGTFVDLMDEWIVHLDKPYVVQIGYALFGLAALGFFVSLFSKSRYSVALLPVFLISVFFWMNSNPPFQSFYDFFVKNLGLFREGLRFPFTKFSILMVFVLSVWFSFAARFIIGVFQRLRVGFIYFSVVALVLIYFQLPSFQGYLISPSMKVDLPKEYFEVFDWFGKQDKEARVAKLPLQTYWGWNFYGWNYQGAGFTWFGIPQPTLDREFDRWSKYNETFYNEASHALYAGDSEGFGQALQKYQVKYLFLDESIINAGGSSEVLFIPGIKQTVASLGYTEVFKAGFLTIYDTGINTDSFVSAPTQEFGDILPTVGPAKGDPIVSESFGEGRGFAQGYNCDLKKLGSVYKNGTTYRAEGGGVSCDFFDYPQLKHNQAYALRIKGENKEGRSLKIYLQNWRTNRMDLEKLMPARPAGRPEGKFDQYFVVLPTKDDSAGYTLNLETRSFGRISSENIVEKIEFYALDYEFHPGRAGIENGLKIKNVKKYGTAAYKVDVEGSGLMQLGQSYENGWVTFPKLEHIKIDSWANGWTVPFGTPVVYIVFWPQLLEWGGLILAGVTLLTLIKVKLY